jgi:TPR repeat protein
MDLEGHGTYRDEAAAAKALDTACTQGIGLACAHLSAMAKQGLGASADPARASSLLARACSLGFQPACGPKQAAAPD